MAIFPSWMEKAGIIPTHLPHPPGPGIPSITAPNPETSAVQPWKTAPSDHRMRQLGMVVRRQTKEVDQRLQQKMDEVGLVTSRACRKYGVETDLRSHGRMELSRKTVAFYEEKRIEREEAYQVHEEQSREIAVRALNSMQAVVAANQRNYEIYENRPGLRQEHREASAGPAAQEHHVSEYPRYGKGRPSSKRIRFHLEGQLRHDSAKPNIK